MGRLGANRTFIPQENEAHVLPFLTIVGKMPFCAAFSGECRNRGNHFTFFYPSEASAMLQGGVARLNELCRISGSQCLQALVAGLHSLPSAGALGNVRSV